MSVSTSARSHNISKTTCANFTKFLYVLTVASDGNAMCCTSGFVDDVMFPHNGANGPESKTTRMFRRLRKVALPRAKVLSNEALMYEIKLEI